MRNTRRVGVVRPYQILREAVYDKEATQRPPLLARKLEGGREKKWNKEEKNMLSSKMKKKTAIQITTFQKENAFFLSYVVKSFLLSSQLCNE